MYYHYLLVYHEENQVCFVSFTGKNNLYLLKYKLNLSNYELQIKENWCVGSSKLGGYMRVAS